MSKFEIDLTYHIQKAVDTAKNDLISLLNKTVSRQVGEVLSSGKDWANTKEGLGHEIIRKKVEDYVLSDEFSKKIDGAIETAMDDSIAHAVQKLLNSKARKHLFEPTFKPDPLT